MTRPDPYSYERPSAEVVASVRRSLSAVANQPTMLAETFYAFLFEMAPDLRSMFAPDLTSQMQKMTETLLGAIAMLDAPDTAALEARLRQLGADHATRYHVLPDHYHYIGHALTRAVREVAGSAWDGMMSSSWIALVQWVAKHMIAGADAAARTSIPLQGPAAALPRQRFLPESAPDIAALRRR